MVDHFPRKNHWVFQIYVNVYPRVNPIADASISAQWCLENPKKRNIPFGHTWWYIHLQSGVTIQWMEEILHQLIIVYPMIYRVSTILLVVQDFAAIHSSWSSSYVLYDISTLIWGNIILMIYFSWRHIVADRSGLAYKFSFFNSGTNSVRWCKWQHLIHLQMSKTLYRFTVRQPQRQCTYDDIPCDRL